jgi:hypothetical protein
VTAYVLTFMLTAFRAPAQNDVPRLASYVRIASAIDRATTDPREALLLASIAGFESGYSEHAVGAHKEQGPWQLDPISPVPKDLVGQAAEALRRVRWSYATCGTLAGYTSGSCSRGLREARHREDRATQYLAAHPFVPTDT